MHHAFGFTGGARGVDQLRDVVRTRAVCAQDGGGIGLVFPGGTTQQGFEAVGALAVDRHHMFQMRQTGLNGADHLLEVKTPEALGRDDDLGLSVLEHEVQFTFAEDVHQRVDDRTDARARQIGHGELPPVGQLAGHDVVLLHAQATQAHGHAVGHLRQFTVGEAAHVIGFHAVGGERQFVGAGRHAGVQVIVDGAVMPEALRDHAGATLGQ